MAIDNELFSDDQESELGQVSPQSFSQAVVYSSDWTTETLMSQLDRGNIAIKPRFQRRDAWTIPRKSQFVESLLLGLPIPQIVLAEQKGERGRYIVLDGKQRLLTLQQFTGRSDGPNNSYKLTQLEVRGDLNGKGYADLISNPGLAQDRNAFENQVIRTVVIRGWADSDFLHMVFVRLNTGSVSLSPQELRQALVPGPFVDFIDDKSSESKGLQKLLGLDGPDFRMRDAELLVRFMAFKFFVQDYRGNLKKFLDDACSQLNLAWKERQQEVEQSLSDFEQAVESLYAVFGDSAGRKYNKDAPERRLNRAVLDVQAYYFCQPAIRAAALAHSEKIKTAFRNLCVDNAEFRGAIERTTKSIEATSSRFNLMGQMLTQVLGVQVPIPTIGD